MEAGESPVSPRMELLVPMNGTVSDEGGDMLMTFPPGFNFTGMKTPKFLKNEKLHVYQSAVYKSHFIDVFTTNENNLTFVPEVQTITITDTYKTQHVDYLSNLKSANYQDEVQVVTLTEHYNRQSIEIVWPVSANMTTYGWFKIKYGNHISACMPSKDTSLKVIVEEAIQTLPPIQKVQVVGHYDEVEILNRLQSVALAVGTAANGGLDNRLVFSDNSLAVAIPGGAAISVGGVPQTIPLATGTSAHG
eukprot:Stramenopile-MAST_4_protein_5133